MAQLRKAYDHIALDSPQNARSVRDTLINMTLALADHPENIHQTNLRMTTMAPGVSKNIITGCPTASLMIRYASFA